MGPSVEYVYDVDCRSFYEQRWDYFSSASAVLAAAGMVEAMSNFIS